MTRIEAFLLEIAKIWALIVVVLVVIAGHVFVATLISRFVLKDETGTPAVAMGLAMFLASCLVAAGRSSP